MMIGVRSWILEMIFRLGFSELQASDPPIGGCLFSEHSNASDGTNFVPMVVGPDEGVR